MVRLGAAGLALLLTSCATLTLEEEEQLGRELEREVRGELRKPPGLFRQRLEPRGPQGGLVEGAIRVQPLEESIPLFFQQFAVTTRMDQRGVVRQYGQHAGLGP